MTQWPQHLAEIELGHAERCRDLLAFRMMVKPFLNKLTLPLRTIRIPPLGAIFFWVSEVRLRRICMLYLVMAEVAIS